MFLPTLLLARTRHTAELEEFRSRARVVVVAPRCIFGGQVRVALYDLVRILGVSLNACQLHLQ
jgi:hypothetical protein